MSGDVAGAPVVDVAVIGAGMVGVSTALAAQRRGLSVVLVDRREPGRETSYGNAGILSSGSVMPINGPSLWKSLPGYITNQHPALRWRLGWALSNIGWAARFLAQATKAAIAPRSKALDSLIRPSMTLHRQWIAEAGVSQRLRETGWLKAWRGEAAVSARAEQAVLAAYGIGSRLLSRDEIAELEPAIKPIYPVGLLHTDTASVDSPGAIVSAYAAMFVAAGGTILAVEAGVPQRQGDVWRIAGTGLIARHVVVALGPWSDDYLRPLGYRVPLSFERGYHQEFGLHEGQRMHRAIYDADGGFVLTPVENGVRVTSGVELAHRDAPSSLAQLDVAVAGARGALDFGAPVAGAWRGARPTLPDSLPMIGPAPRHAGLWLAFGHQHIGFSTGPGTGEAIAAMIAGAAPPFDPGPFAPTRYL